MKIIASGIAAGALIVGLSGGVPAQAIEQPTNWKPCRTEDSVHCTFEAKLRGNHEGRSFWHGANTREHFVSARRAKIKVTNGFRYFGWTYLGKRGHHGCYADDDSNAIICRDGARL